MAGILIDAWSMAAYAERTMTASETAQLCDRIERELVAAARRISAALDPHVSVRVEQ